MGRVLVTGATGFLGKAVLQKLGTQGIAQGRDALRLEELERQGFGTIVWTLPGPAPATSDFGDISAIVHCAAYSAPFGLRRDFQSTNVAGTKAVLGLAKALKVKKFIHISSPSVYFSLKDQLDVHEDTDLPKPFTLYAESKIAAEELVRASPEVGPIILRPRGIYGPGDRSLLPRLLTAAKQRTLPRFRNGRAKIDLTFVDDVVDAIFAALDAKMIPSGRCFNISGGEVLSVEHIVERACARAGVIPRWRDMPLLPAVWTAGLTEKIAMQVPGNREPPITRYAVGLFAFEQSLNILRAKNELGWSPKVSFTEGLDHTFGEGTTV